MRPLLPSNQLARISLARWKHRLWPSPAAPAILMYHRVASVIRDPWDLAVSPETFDEQLAYLALHRTPLSLDDFIRLLQQGSLPNNAVAITFDDGYRDNLVYAKPLLEKHRIPATLFLASGWVGSPEPFWWDHLAGMILSCSSAMNSQVQVDREILPLVWDNPTSLDLEGRWRASQEPRTSRETAYYALWRKLQRTSNNERARVMADLHSRLELRAQDPLAMPMNPEEVRRLCAGPIFSLGAHTLSHPAMTSLTTEECRAEVHDGLLACKRLAQTTVSFFAYPYGDNDANVRAIVAAAGFAGACSTHTVHVDPGAFDLYALPRLIATEQPIKQFARKLKR